MINLKRKDNTYLFAFLFFASYYFLRHFLIYENFVGNLPRFEGLFLGLSLLFSSLILLYSMYQKFTLNMYVVLAYSLMSYILIVVYYNEIVSGGLYTKNLTVVLHYVMLYLAGRYFYSIERYYKFILALFIILSVEKIIYLDVSSLQILIRNSEGEINSFYLFLGDSFALFAILLLVLTKEVRYKVILFLVSVFILFIINSRTSLYLYVMTSFFYMYKNYKLSDMTIFLSIASVITLFILSTFSIDELSSHRMISFLLTGEDSSWLTREIQMSEGLKAIANNYIVGDYGGQLRTGEFGSYIHNILSYYRQFGIIAIIIISILGLRITYTLHQWVKNKFDKKDDYIIYLSLFIIGEAIISRAYVNPDLWFAFGMLSGLGYWRNNEKNIISK
jgi:hypothetical protein